MKSEKVSFVREDTSEAEATAAPTRPSATVVNVRILAAQCKEWNEWNGQACCSRGWLAGKI
jgi:hypothetical protein